MERVMRIELVLSAASATLILPLNRASCDGHTVITAPEPSAVELPVIRKGRAR